jgi:hypothetical protein
VPGHEPDEGLLGILADIVELVLALPLEGDDAVLEEPFHVAIDEALFHARLLREPLVADAALALKALDVIAYGAEK